MSNEFKQQYVSKAPVLDCSFTDAFHAISGGIDLQLKHVDLSTRQETVVGSMLASRWPSLPLFAHSAAHSQPIRCVEHSTEPACVVTGSWDQTVKLWDLRSPNSCIGSYEQPGRVFTMAQSLNRLIVGTSGRNIWIWDLRKMTEPEQRRESRYLECGENEILLSSHWYLCVV